MQSWRGLDDVPGDWGRSVVTIGVFDGVHRGHQALLARTVAAARALGVPSVAVTFEPHPAEVVRPGSQPPRLTTARRRAELLEAQGVDVVLVLPFTVDLSTLSPADFAQTVLVDRLHVAAVLAGENFAFGHRAAGDVEILRTLGEKYDFGVEVVPLLDGLSSTLVRRQVASGDMEAATVSLGRPHRVEGVVVRGYQRGRQLGFPTANVETPPHTAIPEDGVYAGWLQCIPVGNLPVAYEGERWPAAISVGTNPTFEGVPRTVEAYALDRDDLELYGTHVAVDFAARLRGNTKFDSIEALIAQIHADVAEARRLTT
ncbi:bifunctional riboflavin kinase/FAD synthetase [Nonomuraea sp. NPDC050556]|uniref:bifunctional riboflavin kinase/FAD synthetase n=1 Tax=Nonomuraea sp. NPDC050556 TaxID=3364369 RepID=UPI0037AFEADC